MMKCDEMNEARLLTGKLEILGST